MQVLLIAITITTGTSNAQELLFEAYNFNRDVRYVGDIDGDGADDFAFVTANDLFIFSGATNSPLMGLTSILQSAGHSLTQYSLSLDKRIIVSPLFDMNGDSKDEFYLYLPGLHPELGNDNHGIGEFFILSYDPMSPGSCNVLFSKTGIVNSSEQQKFGFDPVAMDDVNRDGVRDFIVRVEEKLFNYELASYCDMLQTQVFTCSSNPHLPNCSKIQHDYQANCSNQQTSGWTNSSYHLLISGATMGPLRLIKDSVSLSNVGDINADGYQDIASIVKGISTITLNLLSGKDFSNLYSIGLPFAASASFSVVGAGDVNSDGHDDFAVAPGYPSGFSCAGPPATIYSGKTGSPLYLFSHPCGTRFTSMGDLDQDGHDDFAIAAPGDSDNGTSAGKINVYSGKTGGILFSYLGAKHNYHFGHQADGNGDANGDGYNDLLALEPFAEVLDYDGYKKVGRAIVISGDQCLADDQKIAPGACGCGMVEQGSAANGAPICTPLEGDSQQKSLIEEALNSISAAIEKASLRAQAGERKKARLLFTQGMKQIKGHLKKLPPQTRAKGKNLLRKLSVKFKRLLKKPRVSAPKAQQLNRFALKLRSLLT